MGGSESTPRIHLTQHAGERLAERAIKVEWVAEICSSPEFVRKDLRRPGVMLAFGRIAEARGKWLRVAYVMNGPEIRIVSAMFDGRAQKWR